MTDQYRPRDRARERADEGPTVVRRYLRRSPMVRGSRRRRYGAALLSALVPGTGHFALGERLLGAIFLAPSVAVVAAVALIVLTNDRAVLASRLLDPAVLSMLVVLQVTFLAWRLLAVGSSLSLARPPRYGRADVLPVLLVIAFVAGPQLVAVDLTSVARDTAVEIFSPSGESGDVWQPGLAPGASASPTPTPNPLGERFTVLLIGEDSGPNRTTALTDTMIVASLDPVLKTVSMLSIPRDLVDAPIPGGLGTYYSKINSLAAFARNNPKAFPGSNGHGEAVLAAVIGELVGVRIDYWAKINLPGMLDLVNAVGGINVTIDHAFCDPSYVQYGQWSFGVKPGRWHLNGSQALAYARIRKPATESDFTRAERQQEVLIALRDSIVRGGFLNDPVGFLQAIGRTISTNVPVSMLPSVAQYADQVGRTEIFRGVVTYPLVHGSKVKDPRGSILIPDVPGIQALGKGLFPPVGIAPVGQAQLPGVGTKATPKPGASGATPTPTPTPDLSITPPQLPVIQCRNASTGSGATAEPTLAPVDTPAPTPNQFPSVPPSDTPPPASDVPTPAPTPVPTIDPNATPSTLP